MKLVIDTNNLFTFFWKGSLLSKLILSEHDLYSPAFALEEIENNKSEILQKTKLTPNEFEEFKEKLKKVVKFIPFGEYSDKIPEAFELLLEHQKDIDFLALAIKLDATILSNDRELKKQNRIEIYEKSRLSELI